jgi:hypothetical protein
MGKKLPLPKNSMIDRTGQVWEYYDDELFVITKSTPNGAHQIRHDTLLLFACSTEDLPIEGEFFEDIRGDNFPADSRHYATDMSPWEKNRNFKRIV